MTASGVTEANGDFSSLSVTIPSSATIGTYSIGGKDASGAFATTKYSVTS